ncbi:MAG: heavy-metal-associated domain-containing protein [Clostridia bacterium]|nr:heavy-metal-associated domain-containing protein [Clostridia bacterium]
MAKKIELTVGGMMCGHCVATVKNALSALGSNALVDLDTGSASLMADDSLSVNTVIDAIKKLGFDAQVK